MAARVNLDRQTFWNPTTLQRRAHQPRKNAKCWQPADPVQIQGPISSSGETCNGSALPLGGLLTDADDAIYISDNDDTLPTIENIVQSLKRSEGNPRTVPKQSAEVSPAPDKSAKVSPAPEQSAEVSSAPKQSAEVSSAESTADCPAVALPPPSEVSVSTPASVAAISKTDGPEPEPPMRHAASPQTICTPSAEADSAKLVDTCLQNDCAGMESSSSTFASTFDRDTPANYVTAQPALSEKQRAASPGQITESFNAENTSSARDDADQYRSTNHGSEEHDSGHSDKDQSLCQPGKRRSGDTVLQPSPKEHRSTDAASDAADDGSVSMEDDEPPHKRRKTRSRGGRVQPSTNGSTLSPSARLTPPTDSNGDEEASCADTVALAHAVFDEQAVKANIGVITMNGKTSITIQFDLEDFIVHRLGEISRKQGRDDSAVRSNGGEGIGGASGKQSHDDLTAGSNGKRGWTKKEEDFICAKRNEGLKWGEIWKQHREKFQERSKGTLQVRYSTKLKDRN